MFFSATTHSFGRYSVSPFHFFTSSFNDSVRFSDKIKVTEAVLHKLPKSNNIHLAYGSEGNSWFCFPESPDVSRVEVEGNIRTRGKTI